MKHIHADVIHAWADGAQVQVGNKFGWCDINNPCFSPDYEYRIKPEEKKKVTRWLWALKGDFYEGFCPTSNFYTDEEAIKQFGNRFVKKLEWSATEFEE